VNQLQTTGIVLTRTDFGEADRIVTMLTPDYGKIRLMARGVRKPKSKLAGGIELFSVSDITFIKGKGEIDTLISTRLKKHFGEIVKDINRVQLGYELIKSLHRATEDEPEAEYFELLQYALAALDQESIDLDLIRVWFQSQLLKLAGHSPNLYTDVQGQKLISDKAYSFDHDTMSFLLSSRGTYKDRDIKTLRLMFSQNMPDVLQKIQGLHESLSKLVPLVQAMITSYIRV
jgi:DNA repair protein RecO (recombination protein O)